MTGTRATLALHALHSFGFRSHTVARSHGGCMHTVRGVPLARGNRRSEAALVPVHEVARSASQHVWEQNRRGTMQKVVAACHTTPSTVSRCFSRLAAHPQTLLDRARRAEASNCAAISQAGISVVEKKRHAKGPAKWWVSSPADLRGQRAAGCSWVSGVEE